MKNIRFSRTRVVITNTSIHCRGSVYAVISEEMMFLKEGVVYVELDTDTLIAEEKTRVCPVGTKPAQKKGLSCYCFRA